MIRLPLLSLTLLALIAGCGRPPIVTSQTGPALTVATAPVVMATRELTQPVAGTVRPSDRATVSARVMGLVTKTHLTVGRTVSAGDVLVELQADEIHARLEQTRAALRQAERDFAREHALAAEGAAATETVRTAADRLQLARAATQEAEALLTYTHIRAPFDGVITRDHVQPGDLAVVGQPLFQLEGTRRYQVELPVPESLAPGIAIGSALRVEAGALQVTGHLAELSPAADPSSRTRLARVDLPAATPIHSGQFVRVRWPAGTDTALTIPTTALSAFGQMERVFVLSEGHARLRLVKTAGPQDGFTRIISGLAAGETVILNPSPTLRDGQRVNPAP